MTLQGIFSQSDQCLVIDDPLTALLDRIHSDVDEGNEDYLLSRLPVGEGDEADAPAAALIRRSFAAYRKRQAGNDKWIETRIESALARRKELAPEEELTWLERVSASAGLPYEIVASLNELVDAGGFDGDAAACIEALFEWIAKRPQWLLELIRPNDIEGLFGTAYRAIETDRKKAKHATPVIRVLLDAWMAGKPLCDLERAIGTTEAEIKTCETARHFAVRLASDLAFVAGLPARIIAAKAAAAAAEPVMSTVVLTLAGIVRKGCASPEMLANAIHLSDHSRPAARERFAAIAHLIAPGNPNEDFDAVLERVRNAHMVAMFDEL